MTSLEGIGWVLWGYGTVIVAIGAYTWTLAVRTKKAEQRLAELE